MKTNEKLLATVTALPAKSAWSRGVKAYALELIETAGENETDLAAVADLKRSCSTARQIGPTIQAEAARSFMILRFANAFVALARSRKRAMVSASQTPARRGLIAKPTHCIRPSV